MADSVIIELQPQPQSQSLSTFYQPHIQSQLASQEADANPTARIDIDEAVVDLEEEPGGGQQLPPTDRGPEAWKVLFAASVFEALLWGI